MTVIYRKYRPKAFDEVAGQEAIKKMLTFQLQENTFAHSYLFVGPRGVGKTTMARIFAKSLNCENRQKGDFEPCNQCNSCQEINNGNSLDIIEIDAASHTGVDNVRSQIIENSRFSPRGKYKVFIIDEVHMLSRSSFNALLKTLEEPPENVIFILATTEMDKLPETVVSRCQRMQFARIPSLIMQSRLIDLAKREGKELEPAVIDMIIRISEGCLRDAESVLGQLLNLSNEKNINSETANTIIPITPQITAINLVISALENDVMAVKETLQSVIDRGLSINYLKDQLIEICRDILFFKTAQVESDWLTEEYKNIITSFNLNSIKLILKELLSIGNYKSHPAIPQINLEIALLSAISNNIEIPSNHAEHKNNHSGHSKTAQSTNNESNVFKDDTKKVTNRVSSPKLQDKEVSNSNAKSNIQLEESSNEEQVKTEVDINDIKSKWQRCCEALKKKSLTLPLAAGKGTPIEITNNNLIVSFKDKFHYETMSISKNIQLLEEAVCDIVQVKLKLVLELSDDKDNSLADDLAQAFGGTVL